jgi:predicted nucleotidyltransferase
MSATNDELAVLAEILAKWADGAPGVKEVYLFGSRVRGDHRPDSDVDVRLYLDDWKLCSATLDWWEIQNQTDFAELKACLPGPLAIHREKTDEADKHIQQAKQNPVLRVRKIICVWTPRIS